MISDFVSAGASCLVCSCFVKSIKRDLKKVCEAVLNCSLNCDLINCKLI